MSRFNLLLTVFVALGLFASNARAENADTTADVRCIAAAMVSIGNIQDQNIQTALKITVLYFLGRIDGREPKFDLKRHLEDQVSKMTRQQVALEDSRCGKLLSARGAAMKEMGQEMGQDAMRRGAPQAAPPAPHAD
jgi:hypothetical protein